MDRHSFLRVLAGPEFGPPPRTEVTAVEGVVHSITASGMRFTVPDWDGGTHVFGPAPWPRSLIEPTSVGDHGVHDHEGSPPVTGDRCAVIFIGNGIDNPWVIGFWPA